MECLKGPTNNAILARKRRIELGIGFRELARKAGITHSYLHIWETGKIGYDMFPDKLHKMSKILGIKLDYQHCKTCKCFTQEVFMKKIKLSKNEISNAARYLGSISTPKKAKAARRNLAEWRRIKNLKKHYKLQWVPKGG